MSKPTFTPRGTIFELAWEHEQVAIQVSRIKEHRDGSVKAQLKIITTKEGYSPHLHQAQFNMSASQSRGSLAKIMVERYNENDIDWSDILEQVCTLSVNQYRKGEPVRVITTEEKLPPKRYLIHPLIPEMQPTILYGDKGVAKSIVALLSYIIVTLPWHDNPLGLVAPEKPVNALFLDWETEGDIAGDRFQRLCRGMGLPYMEFNYLRCVNPLADDMDEIQEKMLEKQVTFLIVDSLTPACGGELNAKQALDFFKGIRTLRVSSFIVAQNPKLEDRDKKTILGSGLFTYLARCVWESKLGGLTSEDNVIEIGLFHKYANEDRIHSPLCYSITWEKTEIIVKSISCGMSDLSKHLPASVRIKDLLGKEGKLRAEKMVEILGLTKNNITTTCYRLRNKGDVVQIDDEWGLKEQELF